MQDFKLAEADSVHEMKTQIKRWQRYAEESKEKYSTVDNQVYHLISTHSIAGERDTLLKKWADETKTAENKALAMNQKELQFIVNMPTADPYSGFVASVAETRPNNKGFYKKHF